MNDSLYNMIFNSSIALYITGTLVAIGLAIAIVTIIKFNKGLF